MYNETNVRKQINAENYKTPQKLQILTLTKNISFKMSAVSALKAQGCIRLCDYAIFNMAADGCQIITQKTRVDVV
jgi:hypothetical protein